MSNQLEPVIYPHPAIDHFLDAVCRHVRAKKLHLDIKEELLSHIENVAAQKLEQGLPYEEAVQTAVAGMGDAEQIGKQFDKVHRPHTDWGMLTIILLLCGAGIISMFSLESRPGPIYLNFLFEYKLILTGIGLAIMAAMWAFDYEKLKKYSEPIFASGVLLLLLTSLFGNKINGQTGWFEIGRITLYLPSLAAILMIVGLAGAVPAKSWTWKSTAVQVVYRGLLPLLLFIEKNVFTWAVIYLLVFVVHIWMTRRSLVQVAVIGIGGVGLMSGVIVNSYYLMQRVTAFISRDDPAGNTYQLSKSLEALRSTGWLGKGFGAEVVLPGVQSESVHVYFIHSFGWISGLSLVLLIIVLLYKLLVSIHFIRDDFGKRLYAGMSAWIAIQFIWPMLMIFGYAPYVGLEIPFLSYGGTAGFIQFVAIGLLLSIYRRRDMVPCP